MSENMTDQPSALEETLRRFKNWVLDKKQPLHAGDTYKIQKLLEAALSPAKEAVDVEALKLDVRLAFFGTAFEPPDDFDAHLAFHGDKVIEHLTTNGYRVTRG
jgi:hypothetical protein